MAMRQRGGRRRLRRGVWRDHRPARARCASATPGVDVVPLGEGARPRLHQRVGHDVGIGGAQPQVALGEAARVSSRGRPPTTGTCPRHACFNSSRCPRLPTRLANSPARSQVAIERAQPDADRGDGARHAAGVDDGDDRRAEPLGDLGRRALFTVGRGAVVQPHDALDERDIGARALPRHARERRQHRLAPHHPAVEVVAGAPDGARVIRRIEVVGPALEGRDTVTPWARNAAASATRHGRLPHAAGHAGDDEPRRH